MSVSSGQRRPVKVKLPSNSVSFRVKPGQLRVARRYGELPYISLVNETDFRVEFTFPAGLVKKPDGTPISVVSLQPKSAPFELDVNEDYGEQPSVTIEYQVCVYILASLCIEAVGGSRPEIEIER